MNISSISQGYSNNSVFLAKYKAPKDVIKRYHSIKCIKTSEELDNILTKTLFDELSFANKMKLTVSGIKTLAKSCYHYICSQ